jgi:hypothetical protein
MQSRLHYPITHSSVRETACNFDVPESTLRGRLHDRLSRHKGQISKQLLLPKKELGLMDVLVHLTEQDELLAVNGSSYAETLVQARAEDSEHMMSKN